MQTDRILRLPDVLDVTGLSRSTVYRLVGEGRFPKPVKLSERAIGWRQSDIQQWIEEGLSLSVEKRRVMDLAAHILAGKEA